MLEFSTIERIVFLALVSASVVVFILLARKPYGLITSGNSEPRSRTDSGGERMIRVIKEVLFQQKVVSGRPFAGLMHFAVFLAFMVFLLETTNMLFEPFGNDFLPALLGDSISGFRMIVMVIAGIGAAGIFMLFLRRFVFTKYSPDPTSYESGLVAFFILLLMLTYIDLHGTNIFHEKINWWLHLVIIFIFPLLILNSKHLHLFLAPVNIYFKKFRLWDTPKMNLDFESAESEDDILLGLETIDQTPWKMRLDFFSCVECKRCSDNCPAAQLGLELKPSEFIKAGRKALVDGKVESPVIGTLISEKALGQCTSCMACENICPVGIEHSQVLFGAKAAQALALGTGSVATEFFKTVTNHENPFSAGKDVRNQLITELDIPYFENGKTEYVLWLGCVWAYNADFRNVLKATADVLRKGGVSFGVLKDEKCCGHHSRKQGEEMQFQTLADENAGFLNDNGVKKIITGCPHCVHSLKHEYKEFIENHDIEVVHHSEIFADLVESGKLNVNSNGKKKHTYHDPCYLGRFEGVLDKPRKLITSTGGSLVEMEQSGRRSYCCGGGAAGFTVESKDDKRVDQERKSHIERTGADTLITGCPECKMMLMGTVETTKDISELIIDSIE
ncbi:MAG: (Fe-S)-binding protein [bacterium]|nr:(Fe-S)-binding protein [bacterium]